MVRIESVRQTTRLNVLTVLTSDSFFAVLARRPVQPREVLETGLNSLNSWIREWSCCVRVSFANARSTARNTAQIVEYIVNHKRTIALFLRQIHCD